MAWTSSDVTALQAAIASGTKEVRWKDRTVKRFDSIQEMRDLLAWMERTVAGTTPKLNHYARHKRG